MQNIHRRQALRTLTGAALIPIAPKALRAAPRSYRLDPARSEVGFSVVAAGDAYPGTMPVRSADLSLDFSNVANSRVRVTLDAANARMGIVFATQALKGADLLNTAVHPTISFESTDIRAGASASQAVVSGRVTARGVTRPLTLQAQLSQAAETLNEANPELTLALTGAIDRFAFGANGYASLVGPMVSLNILARIRRI